MNNEKHKIQILQKQNKKLFAVAIVLTTLLVITGALIFVQPIQKASAQQTRL